MKPTLRQIWFQLHWFIGISAGTVLMLIGLTGATLSFENELLDLIDPGVRHVAPQAAAPLTPGAIAAAVALRDPRTIRNITMLAAPGAAVRVQFAPAPGQRRGDSVYVHPYSGALQPPLRGETFFDWVESLHRFLLLPRDPGRVVAGSLALCLLVLAASGLYLRWPRRAFDWRSWLTFDPALKGRSFLWGLHSVLGTWALLLYLVFTSTGLYWSFDIVRSQVDRWTGMVRAPMARNPGMAKAPKTATAPAMPGGGVDLDPAWTAFRTRATGWKMANISVPDKPAQAVQFSWLAADAPHERARNRLVVKAHATDIAEDERYASRPVGARAVSTIYPLHVGTYFGLPGRIAMLLAALALPVFGVTGWMLYLKRRKAKRAAAAARAGLAGHGAAAADAHDVVLVAYASQTGQAERLALQSAAALQRAGVAVTVQSLQSLAPQQFGQYRRALFVASSFGEGEPPDGVRRFARLLREAQSPLAALHYGVLALGDRHYRQFCGFGHTLDDGLRALGGHALFPLIEVDNGDPVAMARWSAALADIGGAAIEGGLDLHDDAPEPPYRSWTLARRELLNPGSQGGPLFEVTLTPASGAIDGWLPGAIAEVLPRQPAAAVDAWLAMHGADGDGAAMVVHGDQRRSLAEALARSVLPAGAGAAPQACADALLPLAPRSYSVASLASDGALQLLVRQERHEHGLGLASGWLTALAPENTQVELRLLPNPAFGPADDGLPCIYIGNGSGLAGLRAHLRERVRRGQRHNWLLFGERQRAFDSICGKEIAGWQEAGALARLDLVFSRDHGEAGQGYVQDRLRQAAADLRQWVGAGAVIYVCGSLNGMAAGVDAALTDIVGAAALEDLIAAHRYRRDVY